MVHPTDPSVKQHLLPIPEVLSPLRLFGALETLILRIWEVYKAQSMMVACPTLCTVALVKDVAVCYTRSPSGDAVEDISMKLEDWSWNGRHRLVDSRQIPMKSLVPSLSVSLL